MTDTKPVESAEAFVERIEDYEKPHVIECVKQRDSERDAAIRAEGEAKVEGYRMLVWRTTCKMHYPAPDGESDPWEIIRAEERAKARELAKAALTKGMSVHRGPPINAHWEGDTIDALVAEVYGDE